MAFYLETVSLPAEIVALAADHLPLRLARALLKQELLLSDPVQTRHEHKANGIVIRRAQRYGDPDQAVRWAHAQVEVLDVLTDYLDLYAANRQPTRAGGLHGINC